MERYSQLGRHSENLRTFNTREKVSLQQNSRSCGRVLLARIKFKRPKMHIATTMTRRLGEIFLVKCQKQAFSFLKREAKVYCYAFLHVLKRDTCIKNALARILCGTIIDNVIDYITFCCAQIINVLNIQVLLYCNGSGFGYS
jgi:hypothetical protein